MAQLQSVILDMDGVISDSEPLHVAAERKTLQSFGVDVTLDELQTFIGKGIEYMLETFIESYSLDTSYQALYDLHQSNLLSAFHEGVTAIDGVLDLIHHLSQKDVMLAVASSSSPELIDLVLKQLRIKPRFKAVVSGNEVKNSKPAPDIFLEALKRMKCEARSSVVIEDSPSGITAARRANISCVGFLSPHSGYPDLSEADLVIDDLGGLNFEKMEMLLKD